MKKIVKKRKTVSKNIKNIEESSENFSTDDDKENINSPNVSIGTIPNEEVGPSVGLTERDNTKYSRFEY